LCDITDAVKVGRLFAGFTRRGEPVHGIVHAAGISRAAMLRSLTPGGLAEAFGAKVAGAQNLARAAAACNLDFFACLSSAAGVWGTQGQAADAAAAVQLDAVLRDLRRAGRPASSLVWTPAGGEFPAGMREISLTDGLVLFERIAAAGLTESVIADVDWDAAAAGDAQRGRSILFDLIAPHTAPPAEPVGNVADRDAPAGAVPASVPVVRGDDATDVAFESAR
jgi:hypothetical protein